MCGSVFDLEGVHGNPPSLGPVGYVFAALWASERLRLVTMGLQTTLSMEEARKLSGE